jgi:hypothetical protein
MLDLTVNTGKMNWYDLYRKKPVVNKTHDIWGEPLENPYYGKTTLKDGRETTFKRGYSF